MTRNALPMESVANEAGVEPYRISFTGSLRLICDTCERHGVGVADASRTDNALDGALQCTLKQPLRPDFVHRMRVYRPDDALELGGRRRDDTRVAPPKQPDPMVVAQAGVGQHQRRRACSCRG